jgi:hypothetical protein
MFQRAFKVLTVCVGLLSTIGISSILLVTSAFATSISTKELVTPTITRVDVVGIKHVSKTTFDFTFRAHLTNTEPRLLNATATITSSSPNTLITEGNLSFGTVQINQTVRSQDTFTMRHDLRYPIKASFFSWSVGGTPDFTSQLGLIQGAADYNARAALRDIDARDTVAASESIEDGQLGSVSLAHLDIRLSDGATVRAVNDALRSVDGRIVSAVQGSPWIVVRIPVSESAVALQVTIASLRSRETFVRVNAAPMAPTPLLLPTNYPVNGTITDLFAIRVPAARRIDRKSSSQTLSARERLDQISPSR